LTPESSGDWNSHLLDTSGILKEEIEMEPNDINAKEIG